MALDEDFFEKAGRVVLLSEKLSEAVETDKLGKDKLKEHWDILESRVKELRKAELDDLSPKLSDLALSSDNLKEQRESKLMSDEKYSALSADLQKQRDALEYQRKFIESSSLKDYIIHLRKLQKQQERKGASNGILDLDIRVNRPSEDWRGVGFFIVAAAALTYGLSAGIFPYGSAPFVRWAVRVACGTLALYAALRIVQSDKVPFSRAFACYLLVISSYTLVEVGAVMPSVAYAATVIVLSLGFIRGTFKQPAFETIVIMVIYFVLSKILLAVLGMPFTAAP